MPKTGRYYCVVPKDHPIGAPPRMEDGVTLGIDQPPLYWFIKTARTKARTITQITGIEYEVRVWEGVHPSAVRDVVVHRLKQRSRSNTDWRQE